MIRYLIKTIVILLVEMDVFFLMFHHCVNEMKVFLIVKKLFSVFCFDLFFVECFEV